MKSMCYYKQVLMRIICQYLARLKNQCNPPPPFLYRFEKAYLKFKYAFSDFIIYST